jgi:hypothetical protein
MPAISAMSLALPGPRKECVSRVKAPEAKRSPVLLPQHWLIERSLFLDDAVSPPGSRRYALA